MVAQNVSLLLDFGVTASFELSHRSTLDQVIDTVSFQLQRLGSY